MSTAPEWNVLKPIIEQDFRRCLWANLLETSLLIGFNTAFHTKTKETYGLALEYLELFMICAVGYYCKVLFYKRV